MPKVRAQYNARVQKWREAHPGYHSEINKASWARRKEFANARRRARRAEKRRLVLDMRMAAK